jgi:hypothetical protein
MGFPPQKGIADTAADYIGLITGFLKTIQDAIYLFRYYDLHPHAITSDLLCFDW